MKTTTGRKIAALGIVGAALMAMAPSAMALSTWNFAGCTTVNCSGGGGSNPVLTSITAFSTTGNTGTTFEAVTSGLTFYSNGYGVRNANEDGTSPNHAIDNETNTDAVLLNFSSSVILRQLLVGWAAVDSDVSVLRYTGSVAPTIAGKSISGITGSLLSDGWVSVGHYETVAGPAPGGSNNSAVTNVNGGGLASSWWLISAYNSGYGGANFGSIGTGTLDYVKLLSVAGDKFVQQSSVPEPGTLALVAAALLGGFVSRSRKAPAPVGAFAA